MKNQKYIVMIDTEEGTFKLTGPLSMSDASDYIISEEAFHPDSAMYLAPCNGRLAVSLEGLSG